MTRLSSSRMTSLTLHPRSAAAALHPRSAAAAVSACHRSSGMRTFRLGVLGWLGISVDLWLVDVGPLHPDQGLGKLVTLGVVGLNGGTFSPDPVTPPSVRAKR